MGQSCHRDKKLCSTNTTKLGPTQRYGTHTNIILWFFYQWVDPHWFNNGSGSGLLSRCRIESREPKPYKRTVLRIRNTVRCYFDPWIRDGKKTRARIRDHGWTSRILFENFTSVSGVKKKLKFLDADPGSCQSWIRDGKIWIRDSWTGINIPDPQHCLRRYKSLFGRQETKFFLLILPMSILLDPHSQLRPRSRTANSRGSCILFPALI